MNICGVWWRLKFRICGLGHRVVPRISTKDFMDPAADDTFQNTVTFTGHIRWYIWLICLDMMRITNCKFEF